MNYRQDLGMALERIACVKLSQPPDCGVGLFCLLFSEFLYDSNLQAPLVRDVYQPSSLSSGFFKYPAVVLKMYQIIICDD